MKEKNRNRFLDLLRGVAIFIVVVGHAIQANYIEDHVITLVWERIICAFQMPLFFAISGYTLGYSFPHNNSQKFLLNKVTRLLIPYLIWASLHYIFLCLGGFKTLSALDYLKELFVSDIWFLRNIFLYNIIVYCASCFILKFKLNRIPYVECIILAGWIPVLFILDKIPFLTSYLKEWFYLWFVAGYFIFCIKDKLRIRNVVLKNIVGIVCVIVMILLTMHTARKPISSRIITIVFVMGIVYCLYVYEKYIPSGIFKWFVNLGKNSLAIYVIHVAILHSVPTKMGVYSTFLKNRSLIISVILTTMLWLFICQVLIRLIHKNSFMKKILLGEKN